MKQSLLYPFIVIFLFFFMTLGYLYPLLQGLILLPLDMLVSNYNPWYIPGQILVKNPYMQDSIIQLFPWKHLVYEAFHVGIIPFWNPYQMMGMPFMAGMKPMVFYPLNILFLLGEVRAWNVLLFLQIFLGLVFMYLLARSFKLPILSSILASLVFSLNSLMIALLEFGSDAHALLWIPLFLYFTKKYLDIQKGWYLFGLGIVIACSIFAGQLQYTGYGLLLLVAFVIFYGRLTRTTLITYGFVFASIALGVLLSAVQLLPSIELFNTSFRGLGNSYHIFADGLLKPYQLFRLFAPDFFGNPVSRDLTIGYIESSGYFGIIPLFFALYAMIFVRQNKIVTFFTIIFIASLLLSIQGVGQVIYFLKIPVLSSGDGDRIFSLIYISAAILAGFGVIEFISIKQIRQNLVGLIAFAILAFFVLLSGIFINHATKDTIKNFIHNVQFPLLIFGSFMIVSFLYLIVKPRFKFSSALFVCMIICITFFDLFRFGYRFLTFSNDKFLYPQLPVTTFVQKQQQESLERDMGLTEPDLASYLAVYTPETYNPLYIQRSAQLLQALQKEPIDQLPKNKYFLTKGENLKHALDFLGVSLIVVDKDTNPSIEFFDTARFQDDFTQIYKDDRYAVYQNKSAYPRFGLFYHANVVPQDQKILQLLSQNKLDFTKTVILNEQLPLSLEPGTGSAKLIASTLNTQTFSVSTDKPALFYISDTYFPGWMATVNGSKTPIYQANYNFRAILVPAGASRVFFSYIPSQFGLGIGVSISSLVLLFIMGIAKRPVTVPSPIAKRKKI